MSGEIRAKDYDVIFDGAAMLQSYREYMSDLQARKAYLGIPSIDQSLGGIRPGQLCGVIAPTNVGKTSFWIPAAIKTAARMKDKAVIVICTEPTEIEIFERLIQQRMDLYTFEVENIFRRGETEKISETEKIIQNDWSNIFLIVKRIKAAEIPQYVSAVEKLYDIEAGMLIVDHVQGIRPEVMNRTEGLESIMIQTKEFINQRRIAGLVTSHVARSEVKPEGREEKKLNLYSGKGSGEIENSCQIVFTLELITKESSLPADPGLLELYYNETYKILELVPHKKKQGKAEKTILLFNKKTTEIREYQRQPVTDGF